MKRKEVEDVMGGKDAWANVDRADGKEGVFFAFGSLFEEWGGKGLTERDGVL